METLEMKTLFIGAHPDDIETMLGYAVLNADEAFAIIATNGDESTINLTGDPSFVKNGKRQTESNEGLLRLGISIDHQIYLDLQDGGLNSAEVDLVKAIEETISLNGISCVMTLGASGYDYHSDHVATHSAATHALQNLREHGHEVTLLALNNKQAGSQHITGALEAKLQAMSAHESQFSIRSAGSHAYQNPVELAGYALGRSWWEGFAYHPIILDGETYDQL